MILIPSLASRECVLCNSTEASIEEFRVEQNSSKDSATNFRAKNPGSSTVRRRLPWNGFDS